ncbi:1-phosphofructokinase [Leucobacter massiliensis]|uniref:1-phosphofructokinase n=1 Tax=Leucobacter massiliensis TaxID=1686285 RepID=A0A2S9QKE5_9MICO|nr:1-phosphofructokinase [Leucobacter massiliensis]PRI10027.1 1-phosphofructokinase [Leucobacter massiliensis]PRI10060.1 1-phosphofructokinase [Leucobacter massiliensis]
MITTLTPNPSVDRAITVDALDRGQVLRAHSSRVDPGGKGVNVGRALAAMGAEPVVAVPSGGPEGALFEALLRQTGVATRIVPISGSVRMNVSVLEPDGTTTKLNEAGPRLREAEAEALLAAALDGADEGRWIAGCGSLPPGVPDTFYATLIREARSRGALLAIDSSGPAFAAAVAAAPDLIKPNREELAELVGRPLRTMGAVIDSARELVASGIRYVAVSLGRDGALLASRTGEVHAAAVISDPVSTVGAGDCMLAGLLFGLDRGEAPAEALSRGVSWGVAAVRLPGTEVPGPAAVAAVQVTRSPEPDRELPLTD